MSFRIREKKLRSLGYSVINESDTTVDDIKLVENYLKGVSNLSQELIITTVENNNSRMFLWSAFKNNRQNWNIMYKRGRERIFDPDVPTNELYEKFSTAFRQVRGNMAGGRRLRSRKLTRRRKQTRRRH
jgi:hypothetical protein